MSDILLSSSSPSGLRQSGAPTSPAPAKIDRPGVYDLPADVYHGDCCAGPSLSSHGARKLIESCPAAYWHDSPLNPAYQPKRKAAFDIGTAAHLIFLEPERWADRVVVIDAPDYKTKDARAFRDGAWADGRVPLLVHERDDILAMRRALMGHKIARRAFAGGVAERTYAWRDPEFGVWLKARPDFVPDHGEWIVDYKTSASANPRAFTRVVFEKGYFQQAAWYLDAHETLTGARPREFWFVVQEPEPPYLVSVCKLDDHPIETGRMLNRRAVSIFARCLATGEWPGYRDAKTPGRDSAFVVGLPGYAEFQLQDRFEAGEFDVLRPTAKAKRLALEAQAPI